MTVSSLWTRRADELPDAVGSFRRLEMWFWPMSLVVQGLLSILRVLLDVIIFVPAGSAAVFVNWNDACDDAPPVVEDCGDGDGCDDDDDDRDWGGGEDSCVCLNPCGAFAVDAVDVVDGC